MRVIIDRIEDNYVVCECEDNTMVNIEKSKLPKDAKEGTVLVIDGELIQIDIEETNRRKNNINIIVDKLWV